MLFVSSIVCIWLVIAVSAERPTEEERVRLWRKKNVWPPNWQPESEGYRDTMTEREAEIMQLTGSDERWENWMQFVQARLLPKFTPVGFKLVQTPKFVNDKLLAAVNRGLARWDSLPYEEGVRDSIYAPMPPKFIDLDSLAQEVLGDLKSFHEDWVGGMKLRGTSAYGVRMYQNGSTIVMHNDKPHTHVISSIVHIAHQYDDDNEPWPIMIEDHNGMMHSVNLEAGQMLFYESAVCLHGRKRILKGKYYGSIFLHYQPVDKRIWDYDVEDVIASVPPHWREGTTEDHGSRWAGQAITVDSQIVDNAPPREYNLGERFREESDDEEDFYAQLGEREDINDDEL